MKTLVIHPEDKSTDFLKPIYQDISATVVTGGIDKKEVNRLIRAHDRIMMMGHGSPEGLFAVGAFTGEPYYYHIIDESTVSLLQQKKENIYIWCHADKFVNEFDLNGFYTGMFISEVREAEMYDLYVSDEEVNFSNQLFSSLAGKVIVNNAQLIHDHLKNKYVIKNNPVNQFNRERLYWR